MIGVGSKLIGDCSCNNKFLTERKVRLIKMRERSIMSLLLAFCLCFAMAMPTLAADNAINLLSEKVTEEEVIDTLTKLSYVTCTTFDISEKGRINLNTSFLNESEVQNYLTKLSQMTRAEFNKEIQKHVKEVALLCINNDNVQPTSSFVEYAADICPEYIEELKKDLRPIVLNDMIDLHADYAGNSSQGINADYSIVGLGAVYTILMEVEWTWDIDKVLTTMIPMTWTRTNSALFDDFGLNASKDTPKDNGRTYYLYREAHTVANFQSTDLHHFYPILKVWVHGGDWNLTFEQNAIG